MVNLLSSSPACTIVDIAVEENDHETGKLGHLVFLILSSCKDQEDEVNKIELDTETQAVAWDPNFPVSLPTGAEGRSIEFVNDSDWALTRKFFVAVQPTANKDTEPHMYEHPTVKASEEDEMFSFKAVLYLSDLEGTRAGIDIGMIRRNHNGLIYVSEQSFGLPLILNVSLPTASKVIGQTGKKHGDLADSYAIAFNPNTFGLNSYIKHTIPAEVKAGMEYEFQVHLMNSMNEPVLVETYLKGTVSGIEGTTGGQFRKEIGQDSFKKGTDSMGNVYNCTVKLETASSSEMAESDRWEMKVEVAGLGMALGSPINFWVTPGPTSASNSKLLKTYDMALAGETVTIVIETFDEYGNRRNFDDEEGDLADIGNFKVRNLYEVNWSMLPCVRSPTYPSIIAVAFSSQIQERNRTTTSQATFQHEEIDSSAAKKYGVRRIGPGRFEVNITSTQARPITFDVLHSNTRLLNSPATIVFGPNKVDPEKSTAYGNGLEFYEPQAGKLKNSFSIEMKDSYENIVPGNECIDDVIVGLIAVKKTKKHVNVFSHDEDKEVTTRTQIFCDKAPENDGKITVEFVVFESDYDYLEVRVRVRVSGRSIYITVPF